MFTSPNWRNTPYKAKYLVAPKQEPFIAVGNEQYLNGALSGIVYENKSFAINGSDVFAQRGDGQPSSSLPIGTYNKSYSIVSASIGGGHTGFITDDSRMFMYGTTFSNYVFGDNTISPRFSPTESIVTKSGVKLKVNKVEAGMRHSLALAEDGTLFVCGINTNGQLGRGNTTTAQSWFTVRSSSVSDISSGWYNSYIISGGFLCSAGINNFGQCGDGTLSQRTGYVRTTGSATDIIQLAGGGSHCLYIKSNNSLWGFGRNNSNQLFSPATTFLTSSLHRQLTALSASKCAAGTDHSAFITTTGDLYVGGTNLYGQIGNGTFNAATSASLLDTNVEEVACSPTSTIYKKTNGTVWFTGNNAYNQTGKGNCFFYEPKTIITGSVVSASANTNNTFFITSDGSLYGMGRNNSNQLPLGAGSVYTASAYYITSSVKVVSMGINYSGYIDSNGNLYMIGTNNVYQLGLGNNTLTTVYTLSRTGSATFDCTGGSTLCVDTNNKLFGVGTNSSGQLGVGNTTQQNNWVEVTQSVSQVRTYGNFTAFIKTNGDLYAMGNNTDGRLGDGTTTQRNSPVFITGSVKFLAKGANGGGHMLFIKNDDTLWGCGSNTNGQLGTGNTTAYSRSIQIDTDVKYVALGGNSTNGSSMYVKNDGSVWVMGRSTNGQLATTGSYILSPVKVMESGSICAIGDVHGMLITNTGSLLGFGNSVAGQIGDGIITTEFTPIQII